MNAPRARPIAVSLGDPAGIGPEITVKARAALGPEPRLLAIGDPATLAPWAEAAGLRLTGPEDAPGPDTLAVLAEPLAAPPRPGQPDPANAAATIAGIRRGAEMAGDGRASALVTAPINKAALIAGAGFAFPGHTEFLAHLSDTPRPVMMLAGPDLRVVPVTIHIPLAEVPARLTPALLEETLRVTEAGLRRDFALSRPRIAVAGLNPHAGEAGAMGGEEAAVIAPVLERLRGEGMALTGPLPADTMFHPAARARYDVAVCMYHDQALIPLKTLSFEDGVNVTLGLPFVRTSPDHGTAYDIAGAGRANPSSMIAAIRMADEIAARRGAA